MPLDWIQEIFTAAFPSPEFTLIDSNLRIYTQEFISETRDNVMGVLKSLKSPSVLSAVRERLEIEKPLFERKIGTIL